MLSVLSCHGLTSGISDAGERDKKDSDFTIYQSHIELLQALILQIPLEEQSDIPANPEQTQVFWDLLPQLSRAFSMKRIEQIRKAENNVEKSILSFQEYLRNYTQSVRNWGYFKRVVEITTRLYQPLDSLYKNHIGLEATKIISIFEYLVTKNEEDINSYFHTIKYIFSQNSLEATFKAYYECEWFSHLQDSPEEAAEYSRQQNFSLEAVRALILHHSTVMLPSIYTGSCIEVANHLNIDLEELKVALLKLSYKFGDLQEKNSEFFLLDNPIWTKPLIQLSEDLYFCSIPQVFFSFIFQTFDKLIPKKSKDNLSRQRASFLENEIEKLMKNAFSDSVLQSNFKWKYKGEEHETDLLVKIDSYLFIVEAKSGSISLPTLRGAPKAMKRDIKELLEYPAIQSKRLADKLWRIKQGVEKDKALRDNLLFDLNKIQKIIRLSITLEDFATLQSRLPSLKETGWFEKDFPTAVNTAVTMTIADLEVVFDVLESTPDKIHYLVRRAELQEQGNYLADELDLLGLYLETTFNIPKLGSNNHQWISIGMSEKIDDYYIAQENNYRNTKPKIKLTKWWSDIRDYIEKRRPDRWSEVAVMMLNVPFGEQVIIEKKFKKFMKKLRNSKYKPNETNTIIFHPDQTKNEAFALVALRKFQESERYTFMGNAANQSFDLDDVDYCLVLGVCINRKDYPYSTLAVFTKR